MYQTLDCVKVLAKSPKFAKEGKHLQFAADMNKTFPFYKVNASYHVEIAFLSAKFMPISLIKEADADEIIEMASKATLEEQQRQIQENIHEQMSTFCTYMNDSLRPDPKIANATNSSSEAKTAPRRSGLGVAVGRTTPVDHNPGFCHVNLPNLMIAVLRHGCARNEDDQALRGFKPSQIQHKDAGHGLFLDGEAIIDIYPGNTYSPAYYQYIPGYHRVDLENPYLIWNSDKCTAPGAGGEAREIWDGSSSDRMWKLLSKPLDGSKVGGGNQRSGS
ncbi:hypothetical protein SASPL_149385 [Salvia splendens]|uniref:Uncharacterized protein n=1 Tax=Salvia splendens TaxID=180675 RepID=A0A8X8WB27_SALSN|nr:hypothetical protein SASPL_149385 [Salvia splendens]